MPAPLLELICCLLEPVASAALAGGMHSATTPSTKLSTPQQRQAKQATQCALDGCHALSFRTTDYCWRHQDERQSEPEPEHDQESNWWEEKME